jgi:hypothetical protein
MSQAPDSGHGTGGQPGRDAGLPGGPPGIPGPRRGRVRVRPDVSVRVRPHVPVVTGGFPLVS